MFMTFDGDFMECEPLSLPQGTEMFYVLVDLCAGKNTVKILDDLSTSTSIHRLIPKNVFQHMKKLII